MISYRAICSDIQNKIKKAKVEKNVVAIEMTSICDIPVLLLPEEVITTLKKSVNDMKQVREFKAARISITSVIIIL